MKIRRFGAVVALLVALALPARTEPIQARMTAASLRELGVNTFTFRPAVFTSDGLTLVAMEKTPPDLRSKGTMHRLWLVTVGVDGKIRETRSLPIETPTLEGIAVTPDDSAAVVISKTGATYLRVPFNGGPVTPLMEHQRGTPGFRAHPSFLRPSSGELLTMGYFYDKDDFSGDTLLASVDPNGSGASAFRGGLNIQKVEKSVPGFYASSYTSTRGGALAGKDATRTTLYWVEEGQEPRKLDEAERIGGFWAAGNRVVYTASRGAAHEAAVFDAAQGQKFVLGTDREPYGYPFLSDDSKTAVVCQLDLAQGRMNVLYARESDGFTLKPVPGLQKVKMGAIRVAPNGRFLAFYNGDLLQFVELP
ncbi:MAG: hypothetical protein AB1758_22080 [Candidatus Eremiobacterota bacterium]